MAGQKRLGELLVEMGFIDGRTLQTSLEEQKRTHRRLGKILVEMGAITEERLVRALSLQLGIEVCDPIATPVHQKVRALLTADLAHRCRVIPIAVRRDDAGQQSLFVATADPLDRQVMEVLRNHVGTTTRIRWMLAGETEIELALARHYGAEPPRSGGHFPPPGKAVYEAPMTSSVPPPRHMPPVIQGIPVAAGRVGVPAPVQTLDVEPEMELVPLSDMLPRLDVRGRPPSNAPVAPILRGNRSESSPPPITRDISPMSRGVSGDTAYEDPLTPRGSRDSFGRFNPDLRPSMPVGAAIPVQEHVLTPDDQEPLDSGEPLNGGSSNGMEGLVIEEPSTLDSDTMPPEEIRLQELPPLNIDDSIPPGRIPTLLDRTGPQPVMPAPPPSQGPTSSPAMPMLGSWGDLFHGGDAEAREMRESRDLRELRDLRESASPPPPLAAKMDIVEADAAPKTNGSTPQFDIDVVSELPLEPVSAMTPAPTTLEPEIVDVQDAEPLEDVSFPAPDTELTGAQPPDEQKWNIALAEAAAEAMAEAEISMEAGMTLEPSDDVTEVPPAPLVTLAPLSPLPAAPTPVVPAAAPIESDVQRVRRAIAAFVAGETIDPPSERLALRAIAAVMQSEGLFDDARIARALELLKGN